MVGRLTERQIEYLRTIAQLIEKNGYPPTVREVGKALGIKSSSTVAGMLQRLQRHGLIEWAPESPRTIRLTWAGRRAVQGGKDARPCDHWTDEDLYIIWMAMDAIVHDVRVPSESLTDEQWRRAEQLYSELDRFVRIRQETSHGGRA